MAVRGASQRRRKSKKSKRVRLRMTELDDGARIWMIRTAKANYWRVAHWLEFDDLIQEGYATYARIVRRYPEIKHPGKLMSLFKRAYINTIHDLSKSRTKQLPEVTFSTLSPEELSQIENARECDLAKVFGWVSEAPASAVLALKVILTYPEKMREPRRLPGSNVRETLNERLCRLAGKDPNSVDLHEALIDALSPLKPSSV